MDNIRQWASQILSGILEMSKVILGQIIAWWNALPKYHVIVVVLSLIVLIIADYLFKAGVSDWEEEQKKLADMATKRGSPLRSFEVSKARVGRIIVPNIVFVIFVLMPLVGFVSYVILGGKNLDNAFGDMIMFIALIYLRYVFDWLMNKIPNHWLFRFLAGIVLMGGSGVVFVYLLSNLLLPQ